MKLYKVEITAYPSGSMIEDDNDFTGDFMHPDPAWTPEGWLDNDLAREQWVERHGDTRFFWPSTNRLYQSRSGARDRAALIEAYGATAVVIESEPIVWLTPEVRRARRIEALEAELRDLRGAHVEAAWIYA